MISDLGTLKIILSVSWKLWMIVDEVNRMNQEYLLSWSVLIVSQVRCREECRRLDAGWHSKPISGALSPPEPLLHLANPPTWLLLAFLSPLPKTDIYSPLFSSAPVVTLSETQFQIKHSVSLVTSILPLSATPFSNFIVVHNLAVRRNVSSCWLANFLQKTSNLLPL